MADQTCLLGLQGCVAGGGRQAVGESLNFLFLPFLPFFLAISVLVKRTQVQRAEKVDEDAHPKPSRLGVGGTHLLVLSIWVFTSIHCICLVPLPLPHQAPVQSPTIPLVHHSQSSPGPSPGPGRPLPLVPQPANLPPVHPLTSHALVRSLINLSLCPEYSTCLYPNPTVDGTVAYCPLPGSFFSPSPVLSCLVLPCLASWLTLILPQRAKLLALLRIQVQVADGLLVVYVRTVTFISGHRAFSGLQSCLLVFPPKPKRLFHTTPFTVRLYHLFHAFPWTLTIHLEPSLPCDRPDLALSYATEDWTRLR